jgi:rubredoxin
MEEWFIKKLLPNLKCALCGHHYEREDIKTVGRKEGFWFLNVTCPSCRTQGLVVAMVQQGKRGQTISDLSPREQVKFVGASPIGVDDVLDMHNFLKEFDGDFSALFSKN